MLCSLIAAHPSGLMSFPLYGVHRGFTSPYHGCNGLNKLTNRTILGSSTPTSAFSAPTRMISFPSLTPLPTWLDKKPQVRCIVPGSWANGYTVKKLCLTLPGPCGMHSWDTIFCHHCKAQGCELRI